MFLGNRNITVTIGSPRQKIHGGTLGERKEHLISGKTMLRAAQLCTKAPSRGKSVFALRHVAMWHVRGLPKKGSGVANRSKQRAIPV